MRKIVYLLIAIGMVIWLGGSVIRNVIIFDMFVPAETLTLKSGYSQDIINYNIRLFTATSLYTSIAYILMFILFVVMTYIERKNLRREGWLLMSVLLFFLVSPIVIYNIYLDYILSSYIFIAQTPDRKICVARELTKIHEEFLRGSTSEILEIINKKKGLKGEIVVILEGKHNTEK